MATTIGLGSLGLIAATTSIIAIGGVGGVFLCNKVIYPKEYSLLTSSERIYSSFQMALASGGVFLALGLATLAARFIIPIVGVYAVGLGGLLGGSALDAVAGLSVLVAIGIISGLVFDIYVRESNSRAAHQR